VSATVRRGHGLGFGQQVKGTVMGGLAGLERGFSFRSRDVNAEGITNFLLLQHATALGAALHATPLVPALHQAVAGCRIAVAASGFGLDIFRNNPGVDRVIETPSPLRDWMNAAQVLRREKPFHGDRFAIITSVGNERTKVCLQTLSLGSSARIGFTEAPQLYETALTFDYSKSVIGNNLSILQAMGRQSTHFEPEMFFTTADVEYAERMLTEAGVKAGQMVAVFVTQTSVTQRKNWRKERFQAAADFLNDHYGAHIVFVGTAAEAAAIEDLRDGIPAATSSVAGRTTLSQMAALLSLCDVGLTLDTGTMHMGRTTQLPMVIIAPAWSPPLEWLPLGNPRYRILKNGEMEVCPPEYIIDEVSIDDVTSALRELLQKFPPGQRRPLAIEAALPGRS
jgi:ADP-heptose:LPS heptosyltransferase